AAVASGQRGRPGGLVDAADVGLPREPRLDRPAPLGRLRDARRPIAHRPARRRLARHRAARAAPRRLTPARPHWAGCEPLAVRSRIARLDGVWRDTVLLERRRAA